MDLQKIKDIYTSPDVSNNVTVGGWVRAFRGKKFIELNDGSTIKNIQCVISESSIEEELLKKNKPVVFISGHFANFELMSMEITRQKIKLATIYRPLNNYFLNSFMEFLRKRDVCKNQIKKGRAGVRDAIKFVENGFSIALMIDQRVSEGEVIDFFNNPCLTTTLPSQLALKYNLNIIPVSIKRNVYNNFELIFHSAIDANQYKDKLDLTKHLNNHLVIEKLYPRISQNHKSLLDLFVMLPRQ